jgi:hypothetical protein
MLDPNAPVALMGRPVEHVGPASDCSVTIGAIRFVCRQIARPRATIELQTSLPKNDSACASGGKAGRRHLSIYSNIFSSAISII